MELPTVPMNPGGRSPAPAPPVGGPPPASPTPGAAPPHTMPPVVAARPAPPPASGPGPGESGHARPVPPPDTAPPAPPGPPADTGRAATVPRPPSTRGREGLIAVVMVAFMAVMGLPIGVVWALVVPRVELVHVEGGWAFTQENPEQYVAADGIFVFMGFGLGILTALIVWFSLRRWRGPILLTGLVVGSILCQTAAWRFGRIGRDAYQASLDSVPIGWHVWRAPELLMVDFRPSLAYDALLAGDFSGVMSHLALGVLATMAFAAGFTYTVCAGWSKFTSLRKHEEPAS